MMKSFLRYVFYFTWIIHVNISKNLFEKPIDYLFSLHPFLNKHNKSRKRSYKSIINNPKYRYDIGYAFHCMLMTGCILSSCFLFLVIKLFGITIDNEPKLFIFSAIILIISNSINEITLGWSKDTYIRYFKEFEKSSNKYNGYIVALLYHLGSIILAIAMVIFIQRH